MKEKLDERPSLGQEILAVVGLFAAVYLLLCLASYSGTESQSYVTTGANWGGRLGVVLAAGLMSFLGVSAFWLVPLLFVFSIQYLFIKTPAERLPLVLTGCVGILVASSALLAALGTDTARLGSRIYPLAGHLGTMLHAVLQAAIGTPGFILLFSFLFLLSLMISIRFSPYVAAVMLVQYSGQALRRARDKVLTGNRRGGGAERGRGAGGGDPLVEKKKERPALEIVPKVNAPAAIDPAEDETFAPMPVAPGDYVPPSIQLLDKPPENANIQMDREHYLEVSRMLESKLHDFGVEGKVVGISPGPVVTTYEFSPAPGVKISRIVALENDLAMVLRTESVRIIGSVPGKAALGIEIPNPVRQTVYIREILGHEKFQKAASPLTLGLGKDVVGNVVLANLADMPHLLIAGATGQGKSVGINAIICSILFKATPDQVRLLMVDPKRIELSGYENIPHLLHPVVVDPKMASRALQWAVFEMERRYQLMEELRVKNLAGYNEVAPEKLPIVVIIIDELADLMMVASKDVENSVARLAQMARAAGMHLIMATQRPSVDVLTGLIKANFPTRMSFKVSSKIDSRTILDASGAEHLLGKGDMLFLAPGSSRLQRIHSAYISEKETSRVVQYLKQQGTARYDESMLNLAVEEPGGDEEGPVGDAPDEKYDEAVAFVCETGQASISMVQRRFRIGYNRAARIIEMMEREGVVGPSDGAKPREILVRPGYS